MIATLLASTFWGSLCHSDTNSATSLGALAAEVELLASTNACATEKGSNSTHQLLDLQLSGRPWSKTPVLDFPESLESKLSLGEISYLGGGSAGDAFLVTPLDEGPDGEPYVVKLFYMASEDGLNVHLTGKDLRLKESWFDACSPSLSKILTMARVKDAKKECLAAQSILKDAMDLNGNDKICQCIGHNFDEKVLSDDVLYVKQQYCGDKTLAHYIVERYKEQGLMLNLFRQLVQGVAFLERQGWLHLDVKPHNVVVKEDNVDGHISYSLRLIDFGFATQDQKRDGCRRGTPHYMLLQDWQYRDCAKRDAFSLGAIFVDMAYHGRHWPGIGHLFYLASTKKKSLEDLHMTIDDTDFLVKLSTKLDVKNILFTPDGVMERAFEHVRMCLHPDTNHRCKANRVLDLLDR